MDGRMGDWSKFWRIGGWNWACGMSGCDSVFAVVALWRCAVVVEIFPRTGGLVAVGATSGASMVHALLWC